MNDEQIIYAECVSGPLAGDCPHMSFWASLGAAQDEAEKRYRNRARLHQFASELMWRAVPAIERWEMLRDGNPTNVYVETIRVQGAKVHPLDVDAVTSRIMAAMDCVNPAKFEKAVREILRSM